MNDKSKYHEFTSCGQRFVIEKNPGEKSLWILNKRISCDPDWLHAIDSQCDPEKLWQVDWYADEFRHDIAAAVEEMRKPQAYDCPVDPGVGYRLLGKNELLREDDEIKAGNEWQKSFRATQWKTQDRDLDYRRKLKYPRYPGVGFEFLIAGDTPQSTDEIWSFVSESWKSAEHADCNEFKGLPVVRRRRITEGIENKQEVKPERVGKRQNCLFFDYSGESFALLSTPNGKVSLHRLRPFAGMEMIVERTDFHTLVRGVRNCLTEVLLKAGVRLPTVNHIVHPAIEECFSDGFVKAAEDAWVAEYGSLT